MTLDGTVADKIIDLLTRHDSLLLFESRATHDEESESEEERDGSGNGSSRGNGDVRTDRTMESIV